MSLQGIQRQVQILDAMVGSPEQGASITRIRSSTGLPKATVHRLLEGMARYGILAGHLSRTWAFKGFGVCMRLVRESDEPYFANSDTRVKRPTSVVASSYSGRFRTFISLVGIVDNNFDISVPFKQTQSPLSGTTTLWEFRCREFRGRWHC